MQIVLTFAESSFTTKIDGRDYKLNLSVVAENHSPEHAAAVAGYLIQRGLDETLRNAWSTQPADTRNHKPVADRLARIIESPGAVGRTADPVIREACGLARARFAKAGLKSEIVKTLATEAKVRAEILRATKNDQEKADTIWEALLKQAAEIVAIRDAATAAPGAADAFSDLLA